MSLQMATVLEDTTRSIMTHDTSLSFFVATPWVSLHKNIHKKLKFKKKNERETKERKNESWQQQFEGEKKWEYFDNFFVQYSLIFGLIWFMNV